MTKSDGVRPSEDQAGVSNPAKVFPPAMTKHSVALRRLSWKLVKNFAVADEVISRSVSNEKSVVTWYFVTRTKGRYIDFSVGLWLFRGVFRGLASEGKGLVMRAMQLN